MLPWIDSPEHEVRDQVERHFRAKKKALPPEWRALVDLAIFNHMAVPQMVCQGYKSERDKKGRWVQMRDKETGQPVRAFSQVDSGRFGKLLPALRMYWASDPDLVLEILTFARKSLARLRKDLSGKGTRAGKARAFLQKHQWFVRENGELRLPLTGFTFLYHSMG
jgi:hypothetical protein